MNQFIPEQLLGLVAAIYVLGVAFKKVEVIKDNYIPLILVTISVLFSMALQGISANSALQGILCWGVAIGVNQTGKQLRKGE